MRVWVLLRFTAFYLDVIGLKKLFLFVEGKEGDHLGRGNSYRSFLNVYTVGFGSKAVAAQGRV